MKFYKVVDAHSETSQSARIFERACFFTALFSVIYFAIAIHFPPQASAQSYPNKPIRLLVPFSPGGSADFLARIIGMQITEATGQQVPVDNRGGAGGNIALTIASKAPADGYTILIGHMGTLVVNPAIYPNLPYDVNRDLQAITLYTKLPNMLAVPASSPVKSTKELIDLAKKSPGKLNYGSAGNGSAGHFATEFFKKFAKIDIEHIPYKGSGMAVVDLISGNLSMMITGVPALLPHVESGRLRALGVTSLRRTTILPNLVTVSESGLPGFESTQWHGVLAPARTPRPIVEKLNGILVKSLQNPEVKQRLNSQTAEGVGSTPEYFQEFIKSETMRWAPVIRASGLKPDA